MGTLLAGLFTKDVLGKLLSGLVSLLPYAALAGAGMYLLHLHTEVATERMRTQQAQQVAQANAQAVVELKAAKDLQDRVVGDMMKADASRDHTYQQLRKDILSAKDTHNCAGSPPIIAVLRGMRQQGPAPSADASGARKGTPGSPRVQAPTPLTRR